ncbi:MAG: hypothetical protein ABIQ04_02905 [Candidatus Saccharimonadales bacterium]
MIELGTKCEIVILPNSHFPDYLPLMRSVTFRTPLEIELFNALPQGFRATRGNMIVIDVHEASLSSDGGELSFKGIVELYCNKHESENHLYAVQGMVYRTGGWNGRATFKPITIIPQR